MSSSGGNVRTPFATTSPRAANRWSSRTPSATPVPPKIRPYSVSRVVVAEVQQELEPTVETAQPVNARSPTPLLQKKKEALCRMMGWFFE